MEFEMKWWVGMGEFFIETLGLKDFKTGGLKDLMILDLKILR